MSCRRAFDLDLVACLLDRDRPEWRAFRDHYPHCPECAAEVRTWTELHEELAPSHVAPGELLAYEDAPGTLAAAERRRIGAHLEGCPPCRDELATLRATDVSAFVRATPPPAKARRRRQFLWPSVRGVLAHPAFAYGLVMLLVLPAVWPLVRDQVAPRPAAERPLPAAGAVADEETAASSGPRPAPATASEDALREQDAPAGAVFRDGARADVAEPARVGEARTTRSETANRPAAPAEQELAKARARTEEQAFADGAYATDADASWPTVQLEPDVATVVSVTGQGLVVRMPMPTTAVTAGLAEVRVRDRSGRREIREQHFGPPAHAAAIRLPAAWLTPGTYHVDLLLGGDEPVASARLLVAE